MDHCECNQTPPFDCPILRMRIGANAHKLCQTNARWRCRHANGTNCDDIPIKKSRGLGDTVKKLADATGITRVVKAIERITGKQCNCPKRQDNLNKLFPYKE